MVVGCCGAGKSTLSRKLYEKLELPLYHLDQYYWHPNWKETPKPEWTEIVQLLSKKDQWIVDGNYTGTMEIRLKRAETVIFLDYPTWKCLWRVIRRIFKYKGKSRPDMVKGCNERFDLSFLHYVLFFNSKRRKSILKLIDKYTDSAKILILKNDREVDKYLIGL